jgi:hypothetical protein
VRNMYSVWTGHEMDASCDNINRMMGLSHDPLVVMRTDAYPICPTRKELGIDDEGNLMKMRSAKQKVDKDDKAEVKHNMTIVVHDQEEGDCPPSTKEIKYYFERQQDGEKSVNHCYFITTRFKTMSFDDYSEYLFEPKRPELIFGYDCAREEGEKYEYRYYFDENQRCIERKEAMTEEGYDNSFDVKMTARNSLKVFNILAN